MSLDDVGMCVRVFYLLLKDSDQTWTKPFPYRELGQHILCTARGCSREHRLQPKQHTLTHSQSFLINLTLIQRIVSKWFPTRHVHHATVAVVHQVARFTVDATGCDAVAVEEV